MKTYRLLELIVVQLQTQRVLERDQASRIILEDAIAGITEHKEQLTRLLEGEPA